MHKTRLTAGNAANKAHEPIQIPRRPKHRQLNMRAHISPYITPPEGRKGARPRSAHPAMLFRR